MTDDEYPECPRCKTDVLVGRAPTRANAWRCYGCDHRWGEPE